MSTANPDTCPHCGRRINAAAILAHKRLGSTVELTDAERDARRLRMAHARKFRRVVAGGQAAGPVAAPAISTNGLEYYNNG
jgi:hypothetical protein